MQIFALHPRPTLLEPLVVRHNNLCLKRPPGSSDRQKIENHLDLDKVAFLNQRRDMSLRENVTLFSWYGYIDS